MTNHAALPVARLIDLLSTVTRGASSGRLLLSAKAGEAGGSLTFEGGKPRSVHPPRDANWKQPEQRDRETVCRDVAALCASACAADATFKEAARVPGPPHRGLAAADLAMALAPHLNDESWLKQQLMDGPERRLRSAHKAPACPPAETGPAGTFLLGKVGAASPLSQIIATAPGGALAALQALYVLHAIGLLGIVEAADAGAARSTKSRAAIAAADRFLGRTQASASTARPKAGIAGGARRQIVERAAGEGAKSERDELMQRCEGIKELDCYSILEVSRKATEDEIRRAYYKLARLYHPDKVHKPHLNDMFPRLESMFAAITEAYNTLSDSTARSNYDRLLVEKESGHKTPDVREQQAQARDLFLRGRKQLESRQVFEAMRFFEAAVKADPTRAEYFHHLGTCQARNPRWRKRAEESLLTALKLNPGSVESYRELARMYKRGGMNERALAMWRNVLQWDPDNEEALEALNPADRKSGGLLGSLFGKA